MSIQEPYAYYTGLPSRPLLVARTGTPWQPWEADDKELRSVGEHKIQDVWEDNLAFQVHAILNQKEVNWTSTDVVQICPVNECFGDVILWIGVMPSSLSCKDGKKVARQCKKLLRGYGINDVNVEICESEAIHSAGLSSLSPPNAPTSIIK
jgi:hypothetical protein